MVILPMKRRFNSLIWCSVMLAEIPKQMAILPFRAMGDRGRPSTDT
jgi:hypothetical protein